MKSHHSWKKSKKYEKIDKKFHYHNIHNWDSMIPNFYKESHHDEYQSISSPFVWHGYHPRPVWFDLIVKIVMWCEFDERIKNRQHSQMKYKRRSTINECIEVVSEIFFWQKKYRPVWNGRSIYIYHHPTEKDRIFSFLRYERIFINDMRNGLKR